MDFKELEIKTITRIKGKIALGIIMSNTNESLKELNAILTNKEIQIKTAKQQISTTILDLDGYKSNYNLHTLNIFVITNSITSEDINIGDVITVKE